MSPAPLAAGVEAAKGKSLVKELAQDLQRLLELKAKFPGHNLITSGCDQCPAGRKKDLTGFVSFVFAQEVSKCCHRHTLHADFKSPANRDQEEFYLESKSSKCSSRNSDQEHLESKTAQERNQAFSARPLAYPHLAHWLLPSRELNLEPGKPNEFLQLYSIISEQQYTSFYRQNPQQDVTVSSRPAQHGNDLFSVLANPRIYCQKVSIEQGRTSESSPVWGLAEAPERIQGTREEQLFQNRGPDG
ncbi:hypothetical protein JD844_021830 [Phrynosoma platyrhinos]|uniref:Uncharacterized protein n=1 Tax=Phrynosoma platyrhinos TaxID=52577 RepID=A0ABQ7SU69_PHRPL|nr:hypothetical protein JD844_021830 [Phrynosoma platyrhinos]